MTERERQARRVAKALLRNIGFIVASSLTRKTVEKCILDFALTRERWASERTLAAAAEHTVSSGDREAIRNIDLDTLLREDEDDAS